MEVIFIVIAIIIYNVIKGAGKNIKTSNLLSEFEEFNTNSNSNSNFNQNISNYENRAYKKKQQKSKNKKQKIQNSQEYINFNGDFNKWITAFNNGNYSLNSVLNLLNQYKKLRAYYSDNKVRDEEYFYKQLINHLEKRKEELTATKSYDSQSSKFSITPNDLKANNLKKGIIVSEILSKPLSLR